MVFVQQVVVPAMYLVSAILFITGLKQMSKVRSAGAGNRTATAAMALAVVATLLQLGLVDYRWILGGVALGGIVGAVAALRVEMTSMPEMVALFNGLGGGASTLVALSVMWQRGQDGGASQSLWTSLGPVPMITVCLSVLIGTVTLTGSLIAFLKLQGKLKKGAPILLPGHHALSGILALVTLGSAVGLSASTPGSTLVLFLAALVVLAGILGIMVTVPIGGADMPVVVSLLNSYSGMAASAAGFVIGNPLLIIAGAMVGSAGLILTNIMCVAMNRSLLNVLLGGFGMESSSGGDNSEYTNVRSTSAEEAAMVLETAESVIVVPGYGLAVAQAQHAVRELASELEKRGCLVRYAIHPVAGRMPGHMNVLLAEADVPYDQLVEMDEINPDFKNTDVVIILGANDVVNPAALDEKGSPIYGMPILLTHEARTVFVVKRSLSPGYAGIKNGLFERDNTMMIFGDAKKVVQQLINETKELMKAA